MNRSITIFLFAVGLSTVTLQLVGQHQIIHRNHTFQHRFNRFILKKDTTWHHAVHPQLIMRSDWETFLNYDQQLSNRSPKPSFWWRKLRSEHAVEVERKNFAIYGDVLFNLSIGRDLALDSVRNLSNNTRGARLFGTIGDKVYFETTLRENQSFFPEYLSDAIRSNGNVVPGQGKTKGFRTGGFDYANVTGFVNFRINKHFDFQFGHDKLFIGHGYRSFLISDNAFNFPFLKSTITALNGRLKYSVHWAQLQTVDRTPRIADNEAIYKRKAGTFHYLSVLPFKNLELGLFEGITWKRWDDSSGTLPFNYNFINPVILVNSAVLNSTENAAYYTRTIGFNARYNPTPYLSFYSQWINPLDQAAAYQMGVTANGFGVEDLVFQLEYNHAEPGYVNNDNQLSRYFHYGQPLAHPLGDDFTEIMVHGQYRYRDAYLSVRHFQQDQSTQHVAIWDVRLGYLLNPVNNLNAFVSLLNRSADRETQWISLGVATSIFNEYYDF